MRFELEGLRLFLSIRMTSRSDEAVQRLLSHTGFVFFPHDAIGQPEPVDCECFVQQSTEFNLHPGREILHHAVTAIVAAMIAQIRTHEALSDLEQVRAIIHEELGVLVVVIRPPEGHDLCDKDFRFDVGSGGNDVLTSGGFPLVQSDVRFLARSDPVPPCGAIVEFSFGALNEFVKDLDKALQGIGVGFEMDVDEAFVGSDLGLRNSALPVVPVLPIPIVVTATHRGILSTLPTDGLTAAFNFAGWTVTLHSHARISFLMIGDD